MQRIRSLVLVIGLCGSSVAAEDPVDFSRDVEPLFGKHCTKCHGPKREKGGLRLDVKSSALRGGDSGPVIVIGKALESRLIRLVSGVDPDEVMPPSGERLSAREVEVLRAWIDQGAPWPESGLAGAGVASEHWSLQPVVKPPLPTVRNEAWVGSPIDTFVLAGLEAADLEPAPEADRRTLIRRLSFDLLGLPPTPGEIDAFLDDDHPRAYEKLVDRLLSSPRYGERWGRHWLDVARYTESQGFEYDRLREDAWHYRDYVIESFNRDKPYETFVREQVAGDVMEPVTAEGMIATSLLVCGPWDQAGNSQANKTQRAITREEEMDDLVSVVTQTFIGLTVNCARCHSHKFDPIPQADYYRIKAVFEGVTHGERPIGTAAEIADRQADIDRRKGAIAELERRLKEVTGGTRGEAGAVDRLKARIDEERAGLRRVETSGVSYVGQRRQPGPVHRLIKGSVTSPDEVVTPGALSAISEPEGDLGLSADAPEGLRRLKLAGWLVDPRHPLTARVIVNRVWHYHFGRGIVASPNDFGASGARPSHPRLLDWLSARFVERGWSIKDLQRLIVLSATYRQSSGLHPDAVAMDADNEKLWRFAPRRLEAEAVRDAMLSASGQLNAAMAGPSFRPFSTSAFNSVFYTPEDRIGAAYDRRTVYRMNVNSGKSPLLDVFDCPDPSVKTPVRRSTTTPLQALSLMNNSFVIRQAGHLAARVSEEAGGDVGRAIERAYRYTFGRPPTGQETRLVTALAREHGLESVCWVLLNSSEFLYVR